MDRVGLATLEVIVHSMITAMGMQAENDIRKQRGEAMAYNDEAFLTIAEGMRGAVQSRIG